MRKVYRWWAIKKTIRHYSYLREVEIIMESWITKRVIDGQKGRRDELVETQKKIEETDLFINYLRKL